MPGKDKPSKNRADRQPSVPEYQCEDEPPENSAAKGTTQTRMLERQSGDARMSARGFLAASEAQQSAAAVPERAPEDEPSENSAPKGTTQTRMPEHKSEDEPPDNTPAKRTTQTLMPENQSEDKPPEHTPAKRTTQTRMPANHSEERPALSELRSASCSTALPNVTAVEATASAVRAGISGSTDTPQGVGVPFEGHAKYLDIGETPDPECLHIAFTRLFQDDTLMNASLGHFGPPSAAEHPSGRGLEQAGDGGVAAVSHANDLRLVWQSLTETQAQLVASRRRCGDLHQSILATQRTIDEMRWSRKQGAEVIFQIHALSTQREELTHRRASSLVAYRFLCEQGAHIHAENERLQAMSLELKRTLGSRLKQLEVERRAAQQEILEAECLVDQRQNSLKKRADAWQKELVEVDRASEEHAGGLAAKEIELRCCEMQAQSKFIAIKAAEEEAAETRRQLKSELCELRLQKEALHARVAGDFDTCLSAQASSSSSRRLDCSPPLGDDMLFSECTQAGDGLFDAEESGTSRSEEASSSWPSDDMPLFDDSRLEAFQFRLPGSEAFDFDGLVRPLAQAAARTWSNLTTTAAMFLPRVEVPP